MTTQSLKTLISALTRAHDFIVRTAIIEVEGKRVCCWCAASEQGHDDITAGCPLTVSRRALEAATKWQEAQT